MSGTTSSFFRSNFITVSQIDGEANSSWGYTGVIVFDQITRRCVSNYYNITESSLSPDPFMPSSPSVSVSYKSQLRLTLINDPSTNTFSFRLTDSATTLGTSTDISFAADNQSDQTQCQLTFTVPDSYTSKLIIPNPDGCGIDEIELDLTGTQFVFTIFLYQLNSLTPATVSDVQNQQFCWFAQNCGSISFTGRAIPSSGQNIYNLVGNISLTLILPVSAGNGSSPYVFSTNSTNPSGNPGQIVVYFDPTKVVWQQGLAVQIQTQYTAFQII